MYPRTAAAANALLALVTPGHSLITAGPEWGCLVPSPKPPPTPAADEDEDGDYRTNINADAADTDNNGNGHPDDGQPALGAVHARVLRLERPAPPRRGSPGVRPIRLGTVPVSMFDCIQHGEIEFEFKPSDVRWGFNLHDARFGMHGR